jgi:hypothetical protein
MEWAVQGAGDATYRPDHRQHRRGDQRRVADAEVGRRHAGQGDGDRGSRPGGAFLIAVSYPIFLVITDVYAWYLGYYIQVLNPVGLMRSR